MGATFYGWFAVILIAYAARQGVASLNVVDLRTLDGAVYALLIVSTVALLLSAPSHFSRTGYDAKALARTFDSVVSCLPRTEHEFSFVNEHLRRGEESLKRRIVALRWTAGAMWAIALYIAQRGVDHASGDWLAAAFVPIAIAGFVSLCLAAFERGVASTFALASGVLYKRRAMLQFPYRRLKRPVDAR
jgi:hypothetical protein